MRSPENLRTTPAFRLQELATSKSLSLLLLAAFLLALPSLVNVLGHAHLVSLFTRVIIFAIAAISLDLLVGTAGLVSLGHAAFIGLGAYSVAIAAAHGLTNFPAQIVVTLAVAGVFGLFSGAISLRTEGVNFLMITLAFGQMAFFLATALARYGGDDGLNLAQKSEFFGAIVFPNQESRYFISLLIFALICLFCDRLRKSKFGRVLQAIRENSVRVESLGFDPYRYQLVAYAIAGMVAGLAGLLLVSDSEFVSPAYMTWQRSGELIIMILIGGTGSLMGAALGATIYILATELLAEITVHWRLVFGVVLVLVVLRRGRPTWNLLR